jgi:AbrB family looped-hinge helix DNA binding protein
VSRADPYRLVVEERGRVVIPAELRRALGIEAGAELVAHVEPPGRIVLEDRRGLLARLRGSWGKAPAGSAVEELLAERRAAAAQEEAEATRGLPRPAEHRRARATGRR